MSTYSEDNLATILAVYEVEPHIHALQGTILELQHHVVVPIDEQPSNAPTFGDFARERGWKLPDDPERNHDRLPEPVLDAPTHRSRKHGRAR